VVPKIKKYCTIIAFNQKYHSIPKRIKRQLRKLKRALDSPKMALPFLCHFWSYSYVWWLPSISPTFYALIFRTKVRSKPNSKQRKDLCTKRACVKCWWNWHLVVTLSQSWPTLLQDIQIWDGDRLILHLLEVSIHHKIS